MGKRKVRETNKLRDSGGRGPGQRQGDTLKHSEAQRERERRVMLQDREK